MVRRGMKVPRIQAVRWRASRHAWVVAGSYALVAMLWIVGSDQVVNYLTDQPAAIQFYQTVKGVFFISLTGLMVYALVYRRLVNLLGMHEQARQTHENLQAIFDAFPLAIFTLNEHGRVGLWNTAAERLFGWSAIEVHNKPFPAIPEEEWSNYLKLRDSMLEGKPLRDVQVRQLCKDGRIIDVTLTTATLHDEAGKFTDTMVIVTDITELKRTRNIERERDSLRTRAAAMEEVLGVVGHELRTPLASLQAITEVLLTEKLADQEEQARLLKAIHEETIRLSGMVTNMLEAARIGSGNARWQWSVVDVGILCRETLEVIRPLVNTDRIALISNTPAGRFIMKGDEDAIRRLLINLVTNAHKHTRDGRIEIQARSMYDEQGRWMVLTVTDTGRGISPAVACGLGRAFALNEGTIAHRDMKAGAGLGLAICRGIVAAHGGRLAVASTPGKGTVFTIALRSDLSEPAQPVEEPHIIQQVDDAEALLA